MNDVEIYTDGGCHGNPGPGAWAYVVLAGERVECSGGETLTTNNRMELLAVIEALRYVVESGMEGRAVTIRTDSQYVRNGITTWIQNWLRNGWRTSARKPVKNQDLWTELHEFDTRVAPAWSWVRGHSGNPTNERCDELVQMEIAAMSQTL